MVIIADRPGTSIAKSMSCQRPSQLWNERSVNENLIFVPAARNMKSVSKPSLILNRVKLLSIYLCPSFVLYLRGIPRWIRNAATAYSLCIVSTSIVQILNKEQGLPPFPSSPHTHTRARTRTQSEGTATLWVLSNHSLCPLGGNPPPKKEDKKGENCWMQSLAR